MSISELNSGKGTNPDNLPLSDWIAKVIVITAFSVSEQIPPVFVREAKAL